MTEWVGLARVAFAVAGLAVAAVWDIKAREVPNGVWYVLGAAGLALMAADFSAQFGGSSWLLVLAVGAVFAVAVTGGEVIPFIPDDVDPEAEIELTDRQAAIQWVDIGLTIVFLVGAVAVFALAPSTDLGAPGGRLTGPEAQAYSVCIMFGAAYVFFFMGALHGGADAKAFMVLALLIPVAPAIAGLPVIPPAPGAVDLLPFALIVFFNAALIQVLGTPVWFVSLGAARRELRLPLSLVGYPKPVEAVDLKRDFIQGSVKDGAFREHAILSRSRHSDAKQKEAFEALRASGRKTVFVSPKAPFMVYLVAGLLLAVAVTSPLYWLAFAG